MSFGRVSSILSIGCVVELISSSSKNISISFEVLKEVAKKSGQRTVINYPNP